MFYENLKKLCFEAGISMSKLAVDLKISTTTVTGWKRGSRPQPAQVKKIAEYFGVSTDDLVCEVPIVAASSGGFTGGMTDFMDFMKSQQDTIRNLSESTKDLAGAGKNWSESNRNLSESIRNLTDGCVSRGCR
jgi:transcriptional regulator with XRE-family HTH domain